jgi:hypothetical protein
MQAAIYAGKSAKEFIQVQFFGGRLGSAGALD